MPTTLLAGLLYFLIVFAAGFLFGVIRTMLVMPWVGARAAELGEMPLMAVVIAGAAAWVVRRRRLGGASRGARLVVGVLGALLVLAFEALLVVTLRGESVTAYVQAKDPLVGAVYLALIALMAVMPAVIGGDRLRSSSS